MLHHGIVENTKSKNVTKRPTTPRPSRVSSVSVDMRFLRLSLVVERKENEERIGARPAVPKNERSKSKIQTPAVDEQSPLVNK